MASIKKREDGKWRARYRDAGGREHAKHFARRVDAQRWLDEVTASVVTGQYVDPKAGRISFKTYAEQWREAQVHRQSSADHVETMLRRHAYPTLGDRPLSSVLPSEVQAWVKRLSAGSTDRKPLAPSTVGVVHGIVSSVFKAAVRDRRVMANPCEGTKLPTVERRKVAPMTTEQVEILRTEVPDALSALVTFSAGTGMRQGEVLGLTRDRLRLLGANPVVVVDRQLVTLRSGKTEFGPLKTKASYRTIPLPKVVVEALNAHLAVHDVAADGLVFTLGGLPITRQTFGHAWRPAAAAAGLTEATGQGSHALRHYYASLLIRFGESVKTVQVRLGHATAAETLDTYSHLWPDSDDSARAAIDAAMTARAEAFADSLRTEARS
jgi:integrase